MSQTFAHLSGEIGIDEKTIRNIFRDYVNRLEKDFWAKTPRWLGIDEIHLVKPRCVLANIEENTIIDILRDRSKSTVVNYLHRLPGREKIRYVAMDMWQPYKDAVKLVLPQAAIVVDKFHVVRMANAALDAVRKSIREGLTPKQRKTLMHDRFILLKRYSELDAKELMILESWTGSFDDLRVAYDLKEAFYSKDSMIATQRLEQWQNQIPEHLLPAFKDLLTALENWKYILMYFNHRVTNAYTESLNGLIRVMNRMGRGYSFDVLRAKILFTEGVPKALKLRPVYRRQEFRSDSLFSMIFAEDAWTYGAPEKYLGADISTLIRLLEEDKL